MSIIHIVLSRLHRVIRADFDTENCTGNYYNGNDDQFVGFWRQRLQLHSFELTRYGILNIIMNIIQAQEDGRDAQTELTNV